MKTVGGKTTERGQKDRKSRSKAESRGGVFGEGAASPLPTS